LTAVSVLAVVAAPAATAKSAVPKIKVSIVPKLLGLPVFLANVKGAREVAPSLGINLTYTAPVTASATGQAQIFRTETAEHFNVITLSADDPTIPAPALEAAMKAGIQVVSFDSDVIPAARDFFIQDTLYNTIAAALVNAVVAKYGSSAKIAIMSSTPDATIQLAWISAMKAYIAASYPKVTILTIGYGESVTATSLTVAEGIIKAYPTVNALLPIDGAAVVGTAEAVSDLGQAGTIGVYGIGDPLPNQPYFKNGSLQALFLWNEVNQGKLVMYVAKLAYEHLLYPGATFTAGSLGKFTVLKGPGVGVPSVGAKDTIIFSTPLEFTPANYLQYDF
jgi:ABC-type sugar transport system substrate-binding protein